MSSEKHPITLSDVVSRLELSTQLALLNDAVEDLERKIEGQIQFNRSLALGVLLILLGILLRVILIGV